MPDTVTLKQITCANCGGDIRFDPATQLTICNFCGSTFHIDQAKDVQAKSPDKIFPFKVTKEQFETSAISWLSQGEYTPDDVLDQTIFNKITGIYMPVFIFKGTYSANWSAEIGFDRRESYVEYVTDANNNSNPVTRERTVIDWQFASGTVNGAFNLAGVAHESELKDADFALFFGPVSGIPQDYDDRYTEGFGMVPSDKSVDEVSQRSLQPQLSAIVKEQVSRSIMAQHVRNPQWSVAPQYDSYSSYKPLWWITYQYKNQNYSIYVDGLSVDNIHGVRPIDEKRKQKTKRAFYPAYIFTALFVLGFIIIVANNKSQLGGALAGLSLPLMVIGWIYGFIRKRMILRSSEKHRQEKLKKYNAAHGSIQSSSQSEKSGL